MFKKVIVLLIAAGLTVPAVAAEGDGGQAGAFLQVPIGARPTAMGGAYLAVSDDGAAPLFNPAGIALLRRPMFSSSYRFMQLDRSLGYASLLAVASFSLYLGRLCEAPRSLNG